MILCITPNPALDRTLTVPDLQLGEVVRATQNHLAAGGKGINVARAVLRLGEHARCIAPLGGEIGQLFARLADEEGIEGAWTWHGDQTRESLIISDPQQPDATVINGVGPQLGAADWDALAQTIHAAAPQANAISFSGSIPPGVAPVAFNQLLRQLCAAGYSVWVDSSGPGLEAALEAGGVALKMNAAEASALLGQTTDSVEAATAAVCDLRQRTNATAIVTLGGEGAVMAADGMIWVVRPPAVQVVSTVGSGDCFLGGLLVGLKRGMPAAEALRLAAAAGAANARTLGGGQFALEDVERIVAGTVVNGYLAKG